MILKFECIRNVFHQADKIRMRFKNHAWEDMIVIPMFLHEDLSIDKLEEYDITDFKNNPKDYSFDFLAQNYKSY